VSPTRNARLLKQPRPSKESWVQHPNEIPVGDSQ
jgi:hypothetical protein